MTPFRPFLIAKVENLIKGDMAGTPSWRKPKPKDKTRAGGHTSVSLQSLSSHLSFLSFGTGSVSDYDPRTGGNFRPFTLALAGMIRHRLLPTTVSL